MRNQTRLLLVVVLAVFAGCAHQPRLLLPEAPRDREIEAILASARLAPGENIKAVPIAEGEHASVSLVQIRDREPPHIHTRYDITVVLVGGHGTLQLGDTALAMRVGDTAFIPTGTRHFFINESDTPAAALVTFAPPFSGPDQQPR